MIDERSFLEREYWGLKKTLLEISNEMGLGEGTIHSRFVKYGIPRRKRGRENFYRVKVDLNSSPYLSYLLGVRYGDASLARRNYHFHIEVKDKDFILNVKESIAKISNGLGGSGPWLNKRGMWMYYRQSKMLYEFMSKPLEKQKFVIEEHPTDFLRGFYDSEGYVRDPRKGYKEISASNTNKEIIEYVSVLLKKLSIEHTIRSRRLKSGKDCVSLCINRRIDRKKFADLIGFSIARKKQRLLEGLQ